MKKILITFILVFVSGMVSAQTYSKELEKAAKNGDAVAQKDLGVCYLLGYGTKVDYKKSYKWLSASAEQGNADALYYVGVQFEMKKVSGKQDYAYNWYQEAAALGQKDAIEWMKSHDSSWTSFEAKEGNKYAQYEYSKEVYSKQERKMWLQKAAAQGHEQAILDFAAIREQEVKDSLEQDRIEKERLRQEEEARKQIQAVKSKWGNLSVQLKKPGTLLSVIPIDKLKYIDTLTITGFLYDTDIKVLSSCTDLKYFDLRNAIIGPSPETQRETEANRQFWAGMAGLISAQADNAYSDFNMTTTNYEFTKKFARIIEQGTADGKKITCYIPYDAFSGMPELETILFPIRASDIQDKVCFNCPKLKKVILPKYVKNIKDGAFSHCPNLTDIDFPSTLTSIGMYDRTQTYSRGGEGSFTYTGINKFDFSKCTFRDNALDQSWTWVFRGCKNVREVRVPKGIEKVDLRFYDNQNVVCYFPATIKYIHFYGVKEVHFASSIPPSVKYPLNNITIYVPKGCTTAYYAKFGETNHYLEE